MKEILDSREIMKKFLKNKGTGLPFCGEIFMGRLRTHCAEKRNHRKVAMFLLQIAHGGSSRQWIETT